MRLTLSFLAAWLMVANVASTKEKTEDYSKFFSSKLWKEVSKRLGKNGDLSDVLAEMGNSDSCQPDTDHGTIIQAKSSVAAGADFIKKTIVHSAFLCEKACCDEPHCSTAVFQNTVSSDGPEGHGICFLFDCQRPSVCEFSKHRDYTTVYITRSHHTPQHSEKQDRHHTPQHSEKHNQPEEVHVEHVERNNHLTSLAKASTSTIAPPTTKQTPPTKKTPTTEETPLKKVSLMKMCSDEDVCVTTHAACHSGFCQCETGFHPKNGVCRQDCDRSRQFECVNGDASYRGPDCIASYDVCDDIPQCADESDERHCPEKLKEVTLKPPKSKTDKDVPSKQTEKADKTTTKVTESHERLTVSSSGDETNGAEVNEKTTSATGSSQGAIVALSLGMSVTALLLLFVGCRYRNMRTKKKKVPTATLR